MHSLALELGDRAEDVEHEAARRRRHFEVHGEDAQRPTLGFDPLDDGPQVSDRPRFPLGIPSRLEETGKGELRRTFSL
jgi:hypothetical protein